MEDLVLIKNNEAVCTSLDVAEKFNKQHKHVLRAIKNIIQNSSTQNWAQCFKKHTYNDNSGKKNPMYYMNRDGFTILAMGFTGKEALNWKWNYIQAFNKMENIITERKTSYWQETRVAGKTTRLQETDVIKQLAEYAKQQGSGHSDKLYLVYSKLAKTVVKSGRDELTITELNTLNIYIISRLIVHVNSFLKK